MVDHFARLRVRNLIYADHAAMTQLPDCIVDQAAEELRGPRANAWRGLYGWAEEETERLEEARVRILRVAGLKGYEVVFNRGVTSGLNVIARALAQDRPQLVVVCSPLEHQANFLSWQKIAKEVRILEWTEGGVDLKRAEEMMVGAHVLTLTAASNVTGEGLPLRELGRMAGRMGLRVVIDAAQFTAHGQLPVDGWGADFIVTSGHKMYGPVGLGVTFKRLEAKNLEPSVWGGGMIERGGWEAGTLSAWEARMLAEAWEFSVGELDGPAWEAVTVVEDWAGGRALRPRGVRVGPMMSYAPTVHSHDVAAQLAELGVMVRAGQLCAPQALKTYGVPETGVVRFSFGAMTTELEVDRLREILRANSQLL